MSTSNFSQLLQFPRHRPRRSRLHAWSRSLVQETDLSARNFIYPVFVHEGSNLSQPVPSMPGVSRVSLDLLLGIAQECVDLGIPVLALFPVIDPTLKTPDGSEAFNPNGLIPRVVESLKDRFPELGIMIRLSRRRPGGELGWCFYCDHQENRKSVIGGRDHLKCTQRGITASQRAEGS